jgi:hypothetical protein
VQGADKGESVLVGNNSSWIAGLGIVEATLTVGEHLRVGDEALDVEEISMAKGSPRRVVTLLSEDDGVIILEEDDDEAGKRFTASIALMA